MHHQVAVGGVHGVRDGDEQSQSILHAEGAPVAVLVEGQPRDVFHDEVGEAALVDAAVEEVRDVGVGEPARICRSSSKRRIASGELAAVGSTLIATRWSKAPSARSARATTPMPPLPSGATTRQGPSVVPTRRTSASAGARRAAS